MDGPTGPLIQYPSGLLIVQHQQRPDRFEHSLSSGRVRESTTDFRAACSSPPIPSPTSGTTLKSDSERSVIGGDGGRLSSQARMFPFLTVVSGSVLSVIWTLKTKRSAQASKQATKQVGLEPSRL